MILLLALGTSTPGALPASTTLQSEMVIVKEGTKEYHRAGCEVIRDGKGVLAMTRAQAEGRKLTQHDGCDPAKQAEPEASPTGKPRGKTPGATVVYVDGGRHYHTEDCKRLDTDGKKKMALDEAGRKHWPCPECKPPIRPRPR
jgi:hypothetical protein